MFLAAAARGGDPPVDAAAGLLALLTVEAAQRSSRLGRRVTLADLE
jgi:predicted dehydrogenase